MPHIYRHPAHDYRLPSIYMLTLSKRAGVEAFGQIVPCTFANNHFHGGAAVAYSRTGIIVKDAIRLLPEIEPALNVLQYVVMPDHIHLLVHVKAQMEQPLGCQVAAWKVQTNKRAGTEVFEQSFNDQILFNHRSLDTLFNYIRQNPSRLLVRQQNPGFFQRREHLRIDGVDFQAYGNLQLLDNPFKELVVVHRADTEAIRGENRQKWLYTASNGGVLVSPFISRDERQVQKEAEALGARLIIIKETPLKDREKPSAHHFDLCAQGRCLIVAPTTPMPLNRQTCLALNSIALKIAKGLFTL